MLEDEDEIQRLAPFKFTFTSRCLLLATSLADGEKSNKSNACLITSLFLNMKKGNIYNLIASFNWIKNWTFLE